MKVVHLDSYDSRFWEDGVGCFIAKITCGKMAIQAERIGKTLRLHQQNIWVRIDFRTTDDRHCQYC